MGSCLSVGLVAGLSLLASRLATKKAMLDGKLE